MIKTFGVKNNGSNPFVHNYCLIIDVIITKKYQIF